MNSAVSIYTREDLFKTHREVMKTIRKKKGKKIKVKDMGWKLRVRNDGVSFVSMWMDQFGNEGEYNIVL